MQVQKEQKILHPGCQCLNCVNMRKSESSNDELQDIVLEDIRSAEKDREEEDNASEESEQDISDEDSETEDIMTTVFGDDDSDKELS